MRDPRGGTGRCRGDYSVSSIAKWLFVRISFVVFAYFLLRNVISWDGYGGPGGKSPGRKVRFQAAWYWTCVLTYLVCEL